MAVNRIRGAFAVPKKGETFELRAGLVYVDFHPSKRKKTDGWAVDPNMLMRGMMASSGESHQSLLNAI